jgi:hypothetical protein
VERLNRLPRRGVANRVQDGYPPLSGRGMNMDWFSWRVFWAVAIVIGSLAIPALLRGEYIEWLAATAGGGFIWSVIITWARKNMFRKP